MQAKVIATPVSVQALTTTLTENLATQFDLSAATEITITLVDSDSQSKAFLIEVK